MWYNKAMGYRELEIPGYINRAIAIQDAKAEKLAKMIRDGSQNYGSVVSLVIEKNQCLRWGERIRSEYDLPYRDVFARRLLRGE